EGAEQRMVVRKKLKTNALRRVVDRDSRLAYRRDAGGVDLQHRRGNRDVRVSGRREAVGVEAREVGEAPVLVRLGRERDRLVALEQLGSSHGILLRQARSAGAASGRSRPD